MTWSGTDSAGHAAIALSFFPFGGRGAPFGSAGRHCMDRGYVGKGRRVGPTSAASLLRRTCRWTLPKTDLPA